MNHSFDVKLAVQYGMEEAVLLQHLYYWLQKNRANDRNFHDGKHWTYNSVRAFVEIFPYIPKSTLARKLQKLETEGLIVTGNYNKSKIDRTSWYAFTEKGWSLFENNDTAISQNGTTISQNETDITQNGTDIPQNGTHISQDGTDISQNGTHISQNGVTIPDINTYINTDIEPDINAGINMLSGKPDPALPIPKIEPTPVLDDADLLAECTKKSKKDDLMTLVTLAVEHLNMRIGTKYKATTKGTIAKVKARQKEGYTFDDFVTVIDKKCVEWHNDPEWSKFLRPETLFGNKFEGYLNQPAKIQKQHNNPFFDMAMQEVG